MVAVLLLVLADAEMMKRNLMPFLLLSWLLLLSGGGWYGIRGAYNEPKSKDFLDLLLYQFSASGKTEIPYLDEFTEIGQIQNLVSDS